MQSTGKSLNDWIDLYNKKSGEQFCLLPDATMWADHKHGFVTWEIKDGILWIRHSSCDVSYWKPILLSFARGLRIPYICGMTKRNPKAMAKVTGFEATGQIIDGWHILALEVDNV